MRLTPLLACAAASAATALPASAAYVLVDDFEDLTVGNTLKATNGYDGNSNSTSVTVIADTDGGDQAINVTGPQGETNIGKDLPFGGVEDGTTGTLFLQMRVSEATTTDQNFVFSLGNSTSFFGNALAFKLRANTPGDPTRVSLENAEGVAGGVGVLPGVTYDVYAVIDNPAGPDGSLDLYLQSDADPTFASLTQVYAADDFTKPFGGSPANTADITRFAFNKFNGSNLVVDNVYYDDAGVNLTNPIPEPGTLGLAAAGLAAFALRRRKTA